MIIRQWHALATPEGVALYTTHFRSEVLPRLRRLPGFRGATLLQREKAEGIELTVHSQWVSLDAVRAFAGKEVDVAIVAEEAQPFFKSYDKTVAHYEVVVDEFAQP